MSAGDREGCARLSLPRPASGAVAAAACTGGGQRRVAEGAGAVLLREVPGAPPADHCHLPPPPAPASRAAAFRVTGPSGLGVFRIPVSFTGTMVRNFVPQQGALSSSSPGRRLIRMPQALTTV